MFSYWYLHHNFLLKCWKIWKNLSFAWAKFVFQTFKILQFCQKMSMSRFPPSGELTKWTQFAFSNFYCKTLEFSKATNFVKRDLSVDFHQTGNSQKWNDAKKEFVWINIGQKKCSIFDDDVKNVLDFDIDFWYFRLLLKVLYKVFVYWTSLKNPPTVVGNLLFSKGRGGGVSWQLR